MMMVTMMAMMPATMTTAQKAKQNKQHIFDQIFFQRLCGLPLPLCYMVDDPAATKIILYNTKNQTWCCSALSPTFPVVAQSTNMIFSMDPGLPSRSHSPKSDFYELALQVSVSTFMLFYTAVPLPHPSGPTFPSLDPFGKHCMGAVVTRFCKE